MVQLGLSKEHRQHQGPSQEGAMYSPPMKVEWNMSTEAGVEEHPRQTA